MDNPMHSQDRMRQRTDVLLHRQERLYVHPILDTGPLAALSVESDHLREVQLHSGQTLRVYPGDLANIYEQLGWPPPGGAQSTPPVTETRPTPEPEPVAVEPPPPEPVVITQTVEVDNPEHLAAIDAQAQRIAELETALEAERAKPPVTVEVERIVERIVEVPAAPPPEPEPEPVPEMPEALAEFAEGETDASVLRTRFLEQLRDLRSLAVGRLYMTEEQIRHLNILESDTAQRWMLATTS